MDLKNLSEQWKAKAEGTERDDFYLKQVFPAIKQQVITSDQPNFASKITHLILPVGLSPEPLILMILILKPEKICFLYTGSSEKFLDRIVQETGLRTTQIQHYLVNETNVPDIYKKVRDVYVGWGSPKKIAIDITGGKKSMVGGCALAGAVINATLFYLDSVMPKERGYNHPEPGSEHIAILDNPYDVFGDLEFQRAVGLYKELDFNGAANLLEMLQKKTSTPEVYFARELLCKAYAAWDDWRLADAKSWMDQTIIQIERFHRLEKNTPLEGHLPMLREQSRLLGLLLEAVDLFNNPEKKQENTLTLLTNPDYYLALIGNIQAAAYRQEKRGKLDVATLLWYRLVELLSQQRLATHHLVTSDTDYSKMEVTREELLRRFQAEKASGKKGQEANCSDLPGDISLLDGYIILKILKDPLMTNLHIGKIRNAISMRNHGIFAHGFTPLGQNDYQEFSGLVQEILKVFASNEPEADHTWGLCEFVKTL